MKGSLRRGVLIALSASTFFATGVLPASAATGFNATVSVTDNGTAMSLSTHTVHANRISFNVYSTTTHGADITIFRPHAGVTASQVYSHIRAQQGPAAAASTRWLTTHVTIYGGAAISARGTARSMVSLSAGNYTVVDINSVFAGGRVLASTLHVWGLATAQRLPSIGATIDTTSADTFRVTSTHLPRAANYLVRNVADTIHFVVFSPVKDGTTDKDVSDAIASNSQTQPAFYRTAKTSAQAGVLSPGRQQLFFSALLTPGTYDLECFIADDQSGVPHFFMGMHKIVVIP